MGKNKNKKVKTGKIDARTARQIEILKKHYVLDEANKIINVDFGYDTASEIFRDNVNPTQVPMIEHELIDNVTYFFDRIPENYKINLNYKIDYIEDYTFEEIAEAYFDVLELDHYLAYKRSKKIGLSAAIMTLAGCVCIIFATICYTLKCFQDISGQIIAYIIDTAACALIWEALGVLFLYKDEETKNNQKLMDKLNAVSFSDKDGKKVISRNKEEITKKWVSELRKDRICLNCFLLTGVILALLGAITIISSSFLMVEAAKPVNTPTLVFFIIHLVVGIFEIFAGVGCFSKYTGKGPYQKAIVPTMIALSAIVVVDTVLIFTILANTKEGDPKNFIVSSIFSLLIIGFMIFETIYFRKKSKKN